MAVKLLTIDQLQSLLQQYVKSDQLQFTGKDLASDSLSNLFSTTLQDQAFSLHSVKINPTGKTITVDGQGNSSPFTGLNVRAVFGLNAMHEVTLTATATPDSHTNWTLAQSFPALQGTLFEYIQLSDPQLVLSTEDTPKTKKGLSFSGKLIFSDGSAFTGTVASLNTVYAGAPPLQLSGNITLSDGVPTMTLNADQEWGWHTKIGYFNLPLALSLSASIHKDQATDVKPQPKVDASLQFSATLDYESRHTPAPIVLTAIYQTGQPVSFTADITHLVNTDLPALVGYLFDNVNVLDQLPTNFSLNSLLTQGVLTVLVDLPKKQLASVSLDITRSAPWSAFGGPVTLEDAHVVLGYAYPTKRPSCDISGTVTLGDTLKVHTLLHAPDFTETLTINAKDEGNLSLTTLLAHALPEAIAIPDEIPDLTFSSLDLVIAPSKGQFELQGHATLAWNDLPFAFGVSGSTTNTLDISLKREPVPAAKGNTKTPQSQQQNVSCSLALHCTGPITIVDELILQSLQFSFDFEQEKKSWSLSGTVTGSALEVDFTLAASLDQTTTARTITLTGKTGADDISLNLGSGSLTAKNFAIIITKALSATTQLTGVKAQADSAYSWNVSATGGANVPGVFTLDGTLALWKDDTGVGLSFQPTDAQVAIILRPLEYFTMNLELDHLSIVRAKDASGNTSWSFDTLIDLWFSNVPDRIHLPEILPSTQARRIKAHLKVDKDGVVLSVSQLVSIPAFALPDINFGTRQLQLGEAAIEVSQLAVQLGKDLSLSTDFGFGIPQQFNSIFGTHSDGSPAVDFFNVYQPMPASADGSEAANPTITRFKLSLDSGNGLQVQMLNSPLKAITPITEGVPAGENPTSYLIDLQDFGAFTFQMPVLSYNGNSFTGSAGLKVVPGRSLKLPLTPLKDLLAACKLEAIANTIPDGLPIQEVKIYDSASGAFNPDAGNALVSLLGDLSTALSKELPGYSFSLGDTVEQGLRELASDLNKLPDSFKDYLDIHIPTDFSFALSISEEGAIQGHLSTGATHALAGGGPTQTGNPIKVLYPAMGPLGPQLNGLTLYSFSIGELFGGAVLPVTIDMEAHQFPLATLVAALALPGSSQTVLPSSQNLDTRIIINNLFMLLIYETVIPIPVPIFFDQLGLEYLGIEGVNFQNHWSFPNPLDTAGTSALLTVLKDLGMFFTQRDYLLDTSTLPKVLPTFTVGPNTLQLPKYLNSTTLISPTDTHFNTVIDNTANVAHLLNALKTLSINEIVQAIPFDKRVGMAELSFAGFDVAEMDWLITTLSEFSSLTSAELASVHLTAGDIGPLLQILPASQATTQVDGLKAQIAARTQELQTAQTQLKTLLAQEQSLLPALQTVQGSLAQFIGSTASQLAQVQAQAGVSALLALVTAQEQVIAQWQALLPTMHNQLTSIHSLLMNVQSLLSSESPLFAPALGTLSASIQAAEAMDSAITEWIKHLQSLQSPTTASSWTTALAAQDAVVTLIREQIPQLQNDISILQKTAGIVSTVPIIFPQGIGILQSLQVQIGTFSPELSQISNGLAQLPSQLPGGKLSTVIVAQEKLLQETQAQLTTLQSQFTPLQHALEATSSALQSAQVPGATINSSAFIELAQAIVQSLAQATHSISMWQQMSQTAASTTGNAYFVAQEDLIMQIGQMPQLHNQLAALPIQIGSDNVMFTQALQQVTSADNTALANLTALLNQAQATANASGLVLLLRGQVLEALTLEFGLSVGQLGVDIGAALLGKIADLFEFEVYGLVVVDPKASPVFRVMLDGEIAIPALGMKDQGTLTIDTQGFDLLIDGQLFGNNDVLSVSLHMSGGNLQDGDTFNVVASFQNNLLDYLKNICTQ